MKIKNLHSVPLTNTDGEITPQGLQLCVAYARASKRQRKSGTSAVRSIVRTLYKQPSFTQIFDEIDRSPSTRDLYL